MVKALSVNEQMEDLDFYKEMQKRRDITSKYQIDEYYMDIEDRLTDINIKKQAIEVVSLIESQLLENEKLQDDEEDEQENNEEFDPISFLEPETEGYVRGDHAQHGSPQPEVFEAENLEMPEFKMTEEEREALQELASFNKKGLENIESRAPKTTTLAAKQGIDTAKEGFKNAKKFINSKIENIDHEQVEENMQTTFTVLKVVAHMAEKGIVKFYKIPAKRAYKRDLDYNIAESTGKYNGKDFMEKGKNEMKHHFYVDWLPKMILLLSAFLIYNNLWTIGWITLAVGLVYYVYTYVSFDYGGSRMLNILAMFMDKQGIRLKDSYKNNMLVLYRYFNEFQSALGVTIDENAGVDITEDPDLGFILHFYVNEDRNVVISSLTDHKLNYYKILPYLDTYNKRAKLQEKRKVTVMLDQVLLMAINKDENLADLLASKEDYWDYFPELKNLADAREQEENALLLKKEREKVIAEVRKTIESRGINENAIHAISTIYDRKREWKFNLWNVGSKGIEGNQNYLKIRCIFNQNGNISTVNRLKEELESQFRSQILIKPLQDRGSFDLYILFIATLKPEALVVADVKEYNLKDEIYIGNSLTGKLSTKWNYAANHIIVGGKSGSGKSVELVGLLTQLSWLKSYDYKTMFITSSSKIGDFVPFAKNGALVTSGVEKQEKVFQYVLDMLTKREEEFYKADVDSLKSFNETYPEKAYKQIVLVADEWENSLGDLDKKLANRLEGLLVQILNIARSSGCIVIVGAQSILKGNIGIVIDKMFVKYSGSNNKNILRTIDPEIADYYATLDREPQGVFFYASENTRAKQESLFFGDTNYTLVQTPFLKEIKSKTLASKLPKLHGKEFENEIFNGTPKDEPEVILSNLKDEELAPETVLKPKMAEEELSEDGFAY